MTPLVIVPLVVSALWLLARVLLHRAGPKQEQSVEQEQIKSDGQQTVEQQRMETQQRVEEIRHDTMGGLGNRLHVLRERGRLRR